jgi:hypothetical protein
VLNVNFVLQLLIGRLQLSPRTGQVQLDDQSGAVDVVVAPSSGDHAKHTSCHSRCCCADMRPGDYFPCPYVHSCCVGALIAVLRYQVVAERFQVS